MEYYYYQANDNNLDKTYQNMIVVNTFIMSWKKNIVSFK